MRNHVHLLVLTGLRQVHFVAEPHRFPLFAAAGLGIIGRAQHALLPIGLWPCPPFGCPFAEIVVLLPDLSQHLHTPHLLQPRRRIGSLQGG